MSAVGLTEGFNVGGSLRAKGGRGESCNSLFLAASSAGAGKIEGIFATFVGKTEGEFAASTGKCGFSDKLEFWALLSSGDPLRFFGVSVAEPAKPAKKKAVALRNFIN